MKMDKIELIAIMEAIRQNNDCVNLVFNDKEADGGIFMEERKIDEKKKGRPSKYPSDKIENEDEIYNTIMEEN